MFLLRTSGLTDLTSLPTWQHVVLLCLPSPVHLIASLSSTQAFLYSSLHRLHIVLPFTIKSLHHLPTKCLSLASTPRLFLFQFPFSLSRLSPRLPFGTRAFSTIIQSSDQTLHHHYPLHGSIASSVRNHSVSDAPPSPHHILFTIPGLPISNMVVSRHTHACFVSAYARVLHSIRTLALSIALLSTESFCPGL